MATREPATRRMDCAGTTSAGRTVRWLVGAYMLLSMLTVAAIAIFSGVDSHLVNANAWFRGVIVAGTSVLTFIFARRAVKGSPRSLLRLRIIVTIILAAIVAVLFFVSLPLWMVTEQAACGALLVGTAFIIFSRDADGLGCEAGT